MGNDYIVRAPLFPRRALGRRRSSEHLGSDGADCCGIAGWLNCGGGQTAEPAAPYHHDKVHRYEGPHHTVHHRFVAHNPAPAAAPVVVSPAPAPQGQPFGLSFPHIAPYPNNKGDEDGLSDDVNDCNKGCVGGAPD